DDVRDLVPGIPNHHAYTVEEVASNRSCVRHYADTGDPASWFTQDDTLASTSYPTATAAAAVFWDDPLQCTPGNSWYSTPAVGIPGAVAEAATGDSVTEVFLDELTDHYQLGTLRPEDMTDTSVRRTRLYNTDNTVANPDQVNWKVLSGGLESSVADLASFGY